MVQQSVFDARCVLSIALTTFADECFDCTEGYYCEFPGHTTPTGPCAPGYYCVGRSNTSTPTDGVTGDICPQGQYCLEGVHEGVFMILSIESVTDSIILVCPAGTFV